ncbi:hypothetical protein B0T19DRAFT_348758 [Cercophora scortea]|uniref:Uncharacterized protein n=1 Tax=Cercophora scortea TaxID=314031 RepID=A0AAE0J2J5_9PEZI|nr:hypothetical protein B0T19DRAFT_348758 [Cercophora scortea]
MTDQDASPPQAQRPRRATRLSSDRARSAVNERMGEGPGVDDTLPNSSTTPDSTATARSSDDVDPLAQKRPRHDNVTNDERRPAVRGSHRAHKHRPSGGFLLTDPVFNAPGQDALAQLHKRHRTSVDPSKHRTSTQGQEKSHTRRAVSGGSEVGLGLGLGLGLDRPSRPRKSAERSSTSNTVTKRDSMAGSVVDSMAGDTVVGGSPRASMKPLDLESTQIVNMALSLNESRRQAARRNASLQAPPKLAPLPDSPVGGSLRQHLQQQRRVSRTISPKPDRSPRISSGRVFSPLHSSLENEDNYEYKFTPSTLARAQKAKEYMELTAQYRRVLDLLPPLTPSRTARLPTVSPPDTPSDLGQVSRISSNESDTKIGRPYNPLQYIRNRKVRARERKVIDGEGQGFNDVSRVSDWVDELAKWVATGQTRVSANITLPPFATAHADEAQNSPPSSSSRPVISVTKPKRPRVDWAIDPADMIADIYWLEQDDNKKLVEDRHWRRVFPQGPDLNRPLSREEPAVRMSTPGSVRELSHSHSYAPSEVTAPESQPPKAEHEHVLSTARDRAQQKLRALKGSHHRYGSSATSRDFLRIHRGSLSDSSDTDSDRRRRLRNGTISSTGKDLLAKQMEEIIAQEQRNAESRQVLDNDALRLKLTSSGLATPEREKPTVSREHSRAGSHRRIDSRAELSETDSKLFRLKNRPSHPQAQGRTSLEVPQRGRRFSTDYDTSQPNSPELRAVREDALIPAIGMDLSPASTRPSSPNRNTLQKVKSIFRDRSRDRIAEFQSIDREEAAETESHAAQLERLLDSPTTDKSGIPSPERRTSRSPLRKIISRGTDTSHKSHRSTNSVKLRGDDSGLRGLFRGPRIDSVLRSGVSKVSDMIWRKESGAGGDETSGTSSSDDSEMERARGRSRGPTIPPRSADRRGHETPGQSGKSYMDLMPQFLPTPEHSKSASSEHPPLLMVPGSHPTSQPLSRRSSRFDLLKPPRLDVQEPSPGSSPPPELIRPIDSNISTVSDTDSRKSSYTDGVRAADARLNAVLAFPTRQFSSASSARHWSIADRSQSHAPVRATMSKREIARLRALLLSSGIHAMEMDRRAKERKLLTSPKSTKPPPPPPPPTTTTLSPSSPRIPDRRPTPRSVPWAEVAQLCPDPDTRARLLTRPIAQTDLYPLAASVLSASIQTSARQWQAESDKFATKTAPELEHRVEALRSRLAGELTDLTRAAAEEADEAYTDLVTGQRLKVKRVVDFIEKMLRRRRRRFRWVRRAGWLAVEWALVGFMWYVWFVVMIARVFLGVGMGIVKAGRWLLWL